MGWDRMGPHEPRSDGSCPEYDYRANARAARDQVEDRAGEAERPVLERPGESTVTSASSRSDDRKLAGDASCD